MAVFFIFNLTQLSQALLVSSFSSISPLKKNATLFKHSLATEVTTEHFVHILDWRIKDAIDT